MRHIGLIAPPFHINLLATENRPKMKLKSVQILLKIIHLVIYMDIIAQNHMLTKRKSRSMASQFTNLAIDHSITVL